MTHEYFVTNFLSGKAEGSRKMRWWFIHSCEISKYLKRWNSKKKENGLLERTGIRNAVVQRCVEWGSIVYQSQKVQMMGEHAALELALVDAVFQRSLHDEFESISQFLLENVQKQVEYHKCKISNFPENRFRELLFNHVKLFTESVRMFVTPDDRRFAECEERRMENTLALAAFSTEWL